MGRNLGEKQSKKWERGKTDGVAELCGNDLANLVRLQAFQSLLGGLDERPDWMRLPWGGKPIY